MGGNSCRRLVLARLAFYTVPWPECFFPMHLLPLRQVSFCRDSLSSARGDTQGADSPCSCGDSGFVSSGCLALSSYPLRVGGGVTATPGAAGWEAVGRAKGGGWRTGTEPLIPLFSFPLLTGRHRNYKKTNPRYTSDTKHTSLFTQTDTNTGRLLFHHPSPRRLLFTPPPVPFFSAPTPPFLHQHIHLPSHPADTYSGSSETRLCCEGPDRNW